MKSTVINSSQLGINCWSAKRFVNSCYKCSYYRYCKYPERVANKEYDQTATKMLIKYREYKKLSHKLSSL